MSEVKILIFDEEELTTTLIKNYSKELTFNFVIEQFDEFDETLIPNSEDNIIILNINKQNIELLEIVNSLSKKRNNNFIIISQDNSTDIQVKVLRAGAKDFLLKPLIKTDFIYSLQKIYQVKIMEKQNNNIGKIITATSCESGIGKTIFLINLAKELADFSNEKVLIMDFNNALNDLSFLLGLDISYNNTEYFISTINETNTEEQISKMIRYKNSSLYIVGNGFHKQQNQILSRENISKSLTILKKHFKYILVDCNEENINIYKSILSLSDTIFYIITSKITNIKETSTFIKELKRLKDIKLILNKYSKREDPIIQKLEAQIGYDIYFKIPQNHMIIGEATNKGKTIKEVNPSLDISRAFVELAQKL